MVLIAPSSPRLPALLVGCLFLLASTGECRELDPVLQDIQPGYQSIVGSRYTYINRGEFIDIYDNKSKALYRSIPVAMDEGAGKGIAEAFVVSSDERLLQAIVRVKYVGEIEFTYEIASGLPVENRPVTGMRTAVSDDGYLFDEDPTLLPDGVESRPVVRFEKAPVRFHDSQSFYLDEVSGDGPPALVHVDLLESVRNAVPSRTAPDGVRFAPGFDVDPYAEAGASVVRSFPVDEVRRIAGTRPLAGAGGLSPAGGDPMEVLCLVDASGQPTAVASSPYQIDHHLVRDLIARSDGTACALSWDVLPGRASDLYGIEVRSLRDGSLLFRDEWIYADCLSFGRESDVLYLVGRFGHPKGPMSAIKDRVLAKLRLTGAGARVEWHRPIGAIQDLSVDPDGSSLYTVSDDGLLTLFDAATGGAKVNARGYHETGLIVSTPDHFFMATGGAEEAIALRSEGRAYPLEQFDLHFNQPHLVLEILGASGSRIANAREAYEDRLLLHGISTTSFKLAEALPEVSAAIRSESEGSLTISARARGGSSGLVKLFAWVNHVPVFGKAGAPLTGAPEFSGEVRVPLVSGRNEIQISVMDSEGMESIRETLTYENRTAARGRVVRLLAIGVSDYLGTDYDLNFAAKDADDLLSVLSSEIGGSAEVKVKRLTDSAATKEGILAAKAFFEEGGPDDLALVFLAGHGVREAATNQFFFCPADMDFENFAAKGVAYEEIESLFEGIPALRRVILMDCCHAGELTPGELKRLESASSVAAQNGTEVRALRVVNTGTTSPASGGAKVGYGFRDLRRQVGAQVLSAAGPLEFALEGAGMENGLFTFFFLSGIREKTADRNGDGAITVTELFSFVSGKVIELSEGVQQPRFRHANRAFDFVLAGKEPSPGTVPQTLVARPPVLAPPQAPVAAMARAPRLEGRRYPEASERLLTEAEVKAMSFGQLRYAINELYAVYGFAFSSASAAEIRKHFSQFSWFQPDPAMTMELIDQRMSEIERRNIEILAAERNLKK